MNQVDSNLPIFLYHGLKSYPIDWMKTQVLAAHQTADYTTGNNFQIKDSSGVFYTLYKDFFHIADQHFGPLELDQKNLEFYLKKEIIVKPTKKEFISQTVQKLQISNPSITRDKLEKIALKQWKKNKQKK